MEEKLGGKMVKKAKETKELSVEKKKKSSGAFGKIIMVVLITLMFTTAVLLVIARFNDVNVFDKAKEISASLPFVGDPEKKDLLADEGILEERVVNLQAEIKEKEAEVFRLQQQLDSSADEKEALLIEQERLLGEIQALERDEDSSTQKVSEIVTTFEKMSAKSAAPVITNMSDAEAIQILASLKPDNLASILEKMSPEDAAKYTSMMTR